MSIVSETESGAHADSPWAPIIFDALQQAGVKQVGYVPDAGHARLIRMCSANEDMTSIVLTTEEEGIAVCAGAWLGGQRSALLMQSSGVGNCINMLSLLASCRFPFLTVVTMRGEFQEFNPWQVAMGQATPAALEIMGVTVIRVDRLEDLAGIMASATTMAFESDQSIAILLSQSMLGAKKWLK
jgi:sulfopyruvate decarboxylase alpha subunit